MHTLHNVRSVMLCFDGVRTLAHAMLMRPVTLSEQEPGQARIWRACNSPWLVNELTVILAPRSLESVHATIKISEDKLVLVEKANNTWSLPVMATPRPLDENPSAYAQSMLRSNFKRRPDFVKEGPMRSDFPSHGFTSTPIHINPF